VKICKNIQLPAKRGITIYPFSDLEVGDSFFVEKRTPANFGTSRILAQKRTGFKFISRSEKNGVRVWRAA
jgi:hypothetical protein